MANESLACVILLGPTASGKTALLESLFIENRYNFPFRAQVISADSRQAYRGMDIGTAKPDATFRSRLPHHLIDVRDPDEQYTAGDFTREAETLCARILAAGDLPVISGGTGFYLKNFMFGLPASPRGDAEERARLKTELGSAGLAALYEELRVRDPESARRIHRNDRYRILRALEVARSTARPLSSFAVPARPRADAVFLALALVRERDDLYRRIGERVDAMFENGLVGEVKSLIRRGYGADDPGLQAIGYREFLEMGRYGCLALGDVRERIKKDSRNYAKRQMTFFSSLPDLHWHSPDDGAAMAAEIREFAGQLLDQVPGPRT